MDGIGAHDPSTAASPDGRCQQPATRSYTPPIMVSTPSIRVAASDLKEYEPVRLGPMVGQYRSALRRMVGLRQSEILSVLDFEVARVPSTSNDTAAHVLRVALLVLRDYVLAGQYPVVKGERCYLADVTNSASLSDAQQRAVLSARYRSTRAQAFSDRGQAKWLESAATYVRDSAYTPHEPVAALQMAPPRIALLNAQNVDSASNVRTLWRAVRATWSMGVESSAPGREVSVVAIDDRWPNVPLGIVQLRNVVPGIRARDEWLGTSVGRFEPSKGGSGFLGQLGDNIDDARDRSQQTHDVLERLLAHVQREGLGRLVDNQDAAMLGDLSRSHRVLFDQTRADGHKGLDNLHLRIVKRAQTAQDLIRGMRVLRAISHGDIDPRALLPKDRQDLDAGLTKLWHYHMGFVAIELSICGAAPPFGPMRVGKLMAAVAGSGALVDMWGSNRPLGQISSVIYDQDVRHAVPNPGPLVVFTSGLFPGHSAQYNRVRSGANRWRKIGETTGFGSSHISHQTTEAMRNLNSAIDGYTHISRTFGEGSSARFRSIGRALAYAGLPDLLKHETKRPLYALPLVQDPQAVLFGWENASPSPLPSANDVAAEWWHRWVEPQASDLLARAQAQPALDVQLFDIVGEVRRIDRRQIDDQLASVDDLTSAR